MKGVAACVAAGCVLALVGVSAAAEKWDMPTAYPESNFHTQNAKKFAECVRIGTGGELEIVIHGGGSLFKGNEIKRAVQTGQVPIGERLLSAHENENPLFGFDSVPFVATSYAASEKLWQAARPVLEKVLEEQNLVLLYSVPWPPQGIYAKKELNSAADMRGVKFRAYNAATARLAELMGAQPVQIEAAELAQALATGVAESFISSGSTGYDTKVWEHLTHFYDVQAWLPRNSIFVNKQVWDGLADQTKNVLRACGFMAEHAGAKWSEALANWYLQQLAAQGMKVQPAGEQLKADFQKIGEQMLNEWLEKAGDLGRQIIERYQAG